jgi:hypothetical protein
MPSIGVSGAASLGVSPPPPHAGPVAIIAAMIAAGAAANGARRTQEATDMPER